MVVYWRPKNIDALAIKLAEIEGIPLVSTEMELEPMLEALGKL